jgi:hypothetical protein
VDPGFRRDDGAEAPDSFISATITGLRLQSAFEDREPMPIIE